RLVRVRRQGAFLQKTPFYVNELGRQVNEKIRVFYRLGRERVRCEKAESSMDLLSRRECNVTATAPSDIGLMMDIVATDIRGEADERFDSARVTASIDALAAKHAGREDAFRSAIAQLLKAELMTARATAQAVLLKDRHGRRCAERLCFVQDEIIRILFSGVTRHLYHSPIPSGAERMAVVATGGYGRGLMAPESDIDLLFILPYKQTAWGEQVAEAILYCL